MHDKKNSRIFANRNFNIMKNEIIINGVCHKLVDGWEELCKGCSLINECNSQNAKGSQLCDLLGGNEQMHFWNWSHARRYNK